jgi:hypothetical protein
MKNKSALYAAWQEAQDELFEVSEKLNKAMKQAGVECNGCCESCKFKKMCDEEMEAEEKVNRTREKYIKEEVEPKKARYFARVNNNKSKE